jgi:3-hydroxybutyryl-CoA dehydrogenase
MKIDDIKTIAVLGAGVMGNGIVQLAASSGFNVHLYDIKQEFLDKGLKAVQANLGRAVEKGKLTEEMSVAVRARIQTFVSLKDAVADAQLVIEAAPETMAMKKQIFMELGELCSPQTILTSNTSSISLTEIASHARGPERVLGMHFFNPPYIVKLLEIIVAEQTSPETLQLVQEVGAKMTRQAIVVRDSPGFATSRLGVVLAMEAIRMLEEQVASAEDIDKAMELGYRHLMGPLKVTDLVGLDTRLNITSYLYETLGTEQFKPPQLLKTMVEEGKLGKKSGQGFYKW